MPRSVYFNNLDAKERLRSERRRVLSARKRTEMAVLRPSLRGCPAHVRYRTSGVEHERDVDDLVGDNRIS